MIGSETPGPATHLARRIVYTLAAMQPFVTALLWFVLKAVVVVGGLCLAVIAGVAGSLLGSDSAQGRSGARRRRLF